MACDCEWQISFISAIGCPQVLFLRLLRNKLNKIIGCASVNNVLLHLTHCFDILHFVAKLLAFSRKCFKKSCMCIICSFCLSCLLRHLLHILIFWLSDICWNTLRSKGLGSETQIAKDLHHFIVCVLLVTWMPSNFFSEEG